MRILAVFVSLLGVLVAVPADAVAAPTPGCTQLTPAQVSYGAPLLSAEVDVPVGSEVCWEFSAEPGAVFARVREVLTDVHTTQTLLLDATGAPACTPAGSTNPSKRTHPAMLCRLSGVPPFRYVVRRVSSVPRSEDGRHASEVVAQLYDVGDPAACPAHDLSDFDTTVGRFDSHLPYAGLHCWSIVLPPGPTLLTFGMVFADVAGPLPYLCGSLSSQSQFLTGATTCRVAEETPALLFARQDEQRLWETPSLSFPVIPVLAAAGCDDTVDGSWSAPMTPVTSDLYRMTCTTVDVPRDSPMLVGKSHPFGNEDGQAWLFSGDGSTLCEMQLYSGDACSASGPPPYRMVAWSVTRAEAQHPPDAFAVAARLRRPAPGCATGPLLAFGETASRDDDAPCRVVELAAGERLMARIRSDDQKLLPSGAVYDEDGATVCSFNDYIHRIPLGIVEVWCPDLPAGRYLVTEGSTSGPRAISAYDVRSRRGCLEVGDLETVRNVTTSTAVDCYLARGTPGETVYFHRPADGLQARIVPVEDWSLSTTCATSSVRLACPTPADGRLQVLAGGSYRTEPTETVVTAFEHSDLNAGHCATVPRGTTTYPTDGGPRIVCLRLTGLRIGRAEPVYSGSGSVDDPERIRFLHGYGDCFSWGTPSGTARNPAMQCRRFDDTSVGYAVVAVRAGSETFRLHRPRTLPPVSYFVVRRHPRIAGRAYVGNTLRADVGDVVPTPTRYRYRWFLDGFLVRGEGGRTFTLRRGDVGRKVSLRVVIDRDDAKAVLTTSSRVVTRS